LKPLRHTLVKIADVLMPPFVYCAAVLLGTIRHVGIFNFPRCKKALLAAGVFPIHNHYYEPRFDFRDLRYPLSDERSLPGIDWNIDEQMRVLDKFSRAEELLSVPREKRSNLEFYMHNIMFGPGDAEYWYQIIRASKPRRIFEVGSGNSTLMAVKAIRKNAEEDPGYICKHVCFEPYEMPWLEQTGVTIIRKKIEDVGAALFSELGENDILFIDSSHMIRPQGDVLFEYLELLPTLSKGVIVHIHDIFSPRDYPPHWITDDVKFWNEQYLFEAFLSHNSGWKILGSLNYLHHHHFERLKSVAPFLEPEREPGSFYIQKVV
jgi:hypothetical protein